MRRALMGVAAVSCAAGFAFGQQVEPPRIEGSIIVKFKDPSNRSQRGAGRLAVNASSVREFRGVKGLEQMLVKNTDFSLQLLNALPFVEHAEPDYVVDF